MCVLQIISYMAAIEIFTSIVRQSFSFLQEAESVSEVANSKYQSLFFVLKNNREQEELHH